MTNQYLTLDDIIEPQQTDDFQEVESTTLDPYVLALVAELGHDVDGLIAIEIKSQAGDKTRLKLDYIDRITTTK